MATEVILKGAATFHIRYEDDPNASAIPGGATKEAADPVQPAPSSAATSPFRGRAQTLVPYSPSTKEVSVMGGFFREDESKQQSALKHIQASTASLSDDSTSSFSSAPCSASPDNPAPLRDLLSSSPPNKTPTKKAKEMSVKELQEAIEKHFAQPGLK